MAKLFKVVPSPYLCLKARLKSSEKESWMLRSCSTHVADYVCYSVISSTCLAVKLPQTVLLYTSMCATSMTCCLTKAAVPSTLRALMTALKVYTTFATE